MSIVKQVTLEMVRDDWGACHWKDGIAQNDAARWAEYNLPATPLEIAGWDKFSAEDRLWLLLRNDIIPERELRLLACDFAESTLHIFERERPDDTRPRDCIAVARRYAYGEAAGAGARAASWAARAASWAARAGAAARAARDASRAASWAARSGAEAGAASWAARAASWAAGAGAGAEAGAASWDAGAAEKSKQLDAVKVVLKELGL